ncbi:membrane-bound metal-dependent hydrolase YbcI (DUF457 family) [Lipingzhangella halophila]|uniref:Membrane-bound metal-dependent hydrolase YbcI (DUF457 family) n=1 Tax=Lipingzhangella halophila TaxID=1783352 RepID=A0A7W7RH44_9ACTN|nr:metal-dependent hydrolase [Lipingzhangella halophila]MBB4931884.1 membrane-bound metal-dependent hydrolase YbcI (DUF457 family) [Lipingzhangella halophila]
MMGSTHSATGSLAGVVVAGLLGDAGIVELATGAAVGAGAALLPDLDHPVSTATRSQGPASRTACSGLRALSGAVFQATRTRYDDGCEDDGGQHRHLTHTLPACAAVGTGVWAAASHWVGAAVALWLLVSLGLRGLGQCLTGKDRRELSQWTTVSVGAGLAATVVMVAAPPAPVVLGMVVGVGMVVHILGDWLTPQGVSLAWPLVHRGKRWWMFRSPVAFKAGDCWQETAVRWVCWSGTPLTAAWAIM